MTVIALLSELAAACAAHGVSRVQGHPRDWFNALLALQAQERLPQDHAWLTRITAIGGQALLAARAGQPDTAWLHLQHASDLLASTKLSTEAHCLAHTLICAQQAYLCYRLKDDAQAQTLLEAAFQDDLMLEELPGYGFLQIHRIQLLHNMMRIHRARGRWLEALQLGCALLRHLEHPSSQICAVLPAVWRKHWPDAFYDTPAALIDAMHAQIAAELVALARHSADAADFANALRAFSADHPSSQVSRWATFQTACLLGAFPDIVAAAIPVLRQGPLPSHPLWQAVASDMRACLDVQLSLLHQTSV